MATLPTLYPVADQTDGGWDDEAGGTTDLYARIDEDGDLGVDYIRGQLNAATAVAYFELTNMPADFLSMTSIDVLIRHSRGGISAGDAGGGDDTHTLLCQIVDSANGALTNEMTIETGTIGYLVKTETVSFTGVVASNKTTWDGAKLAVRTTFSQSMAADGDRMWVGKVQIVNGVYAAAVNVTPATVPAPAGIPAVTPTGGATLSPATVGVPVGIPAVAASGGAIVNATPVPAPAGVPAVTPIGGASFTPAPVASLLGIPTAAAEGGAVAQPATVPVPGGIPAVSPTGGASPSPAPVPAPAGVPTVTTVTGATFTPAPVAAPVGIHATGATGGASLAAVAVPAPVGIPPAAASGSGGGADGTATPTAVAAPAGIPAPSPTGGAAPSPGPVAAPAGVPAPTPQTGTVFAASTVGGVVGIPAVTPTGGATISAAAVLVATGIPGVWFVGWVVPVSHGLIFDDMVTIVAAAMAGTIRDDADPRIV